MNKLTITYTRPNTSVDWGPNIKSSELNDYYQNNYIDAGLMVSENVTVSEDGLTLTRVTIWNEETPQLTGVDIILQYKTDVIVQAWIEERNSYNEANGIVPSTTHSELVSHEENLMFTGIAAGPYEKI